MRKLSLRYYFYCFGLGLIISGVLFADTWYVRTDGSDDNDGRSNAVGGSSAGYLGAFRNIQTAIDSAGNGDTILVREGTYYEQIDLKGKDLDIHSCTQTDDSVLAPQATIIDADKWGTAVIFGGNETDTCQLHGFTIQNGFPQGDSLALYLKLDEDGTEGTIVSDSSGKSRNGTAENITWVSDGARNQVASFNGSSSYIGLDSYTGISGGASRTSALWIKTTVSTTIQMALTWGVKALDGQTYSSNWKFGLINGKIAVGDTNSYLTGTRTISDGSWHHIAAVLENDGSPTTGEIQLYVDGTLESVTSVNPDYEINTSNAQKVLVGSWYHDNIYSHFFNGQMDDVRIYSRALSKGEIETIALSVPVAHWKLDETTEINVTDSEGTNTGTLFGNPQWQPQGGRIGGALLLDGGSDGTDDYIQVAHNTALDFSATQDFTLSAWFKTSSTNSNMRILEKCQVIGNAGYGYALFVNVGGVAGRIAFFTFGSDGIVNTIADGTFNDGKWHHVIGVRDTVSQELRIYLDGAEMGSVTEPSRDLQNNGDLCIGIAMFSGIYDGPFSGSIDDVRIYDRVLSPDEIIHMAGDVGLTGSWDLDGSADDSSGNALTGTLSENGASWNNGLLGQALELNGSDGYLEVADNSAFDFEGAFTLSAWVKPTADTNSQSRIIYRYDSTSDSGYFLSCDPQNGWRFAARANNISAFLYSDSLPQLGKWTHIVGRRNAAGLMEFFIDGVRQTNTATQTGTIDSSSSLYLGRDTDGQSFSYFKGLVDEVKIYDRAVSDIEIRKQYQQRFAAGGGIRGNGTTATITQCIIKDNQTSESGGGIDAVNGSIANCLIVQNTAQSAGALNNCDGDIVNCTIAGNTAASVGGVQSCDGTITNAILWSNTDNDGSTDTQDAQIKDCTAAVSYCCVQDTTVDDDHYAGIGNGNIDDDPKLTLFSQIFSYWKLDSITNDNGTYYTTDKAGGLSSQVKVMGSQQLPPNMVTLSSGYAMDFNDGYYVECADADSFNITGALTITAWIRPEVSGSIEPLVNKCDSGRALNIPFEFYLTDENSPRVALARASSTAKQVVTSISVLPLNQWSHVAVTVDSSGNCLFYINGDFDSSGVFSIEPVSNSSSLLIGKTADDIFFAGCMGELMILCRKMDQSEIEKEYHRSNSVNDWHLARTSPCIDAGTDTALNQDICGSVRPCDWTYKQNIISGFDMGAYEEQEVVLPPTQASLLSPTNGLEDIYYNLTTLNWTSGNYATSHNIYFGTSETAVNTATTESSEFKGNQTTNSYALGTLPVGTATYYWRIDEVGAGGIAKGAIWHFTATPNLVATAVRLYPTSAYSLPVSGISDRTGGNGLSDAQVHFDSRTAAGSYAFPIPNLYIEVTATGGSPSVMDCFTFSITSESDSTGIREAFTETAANSNIYRINTPIHVSTISSQTNREIAIVDEEHLYIGGVSSVTVDRGEVAAVSGDFSGNNSYAQSAVIGNADMFHSFFNKDASYWYLHPNYHFSYLCITDRYTNPSYDTTCCESKSYSYYWWNNGFLYDQTNIGNFIKEAGSSDSSADFLFEISHGSDGNIGYYSGVYSIYKPGTLNQPQITSSDWNDDIEWAIISSCLVLGYSTDRDHWIGYWDDALLNTKCHGILSSCEELTIYTSTQTGSCYYYGDITFYHDLIGSRITQSFCNKIRNQNPYYTILGAYMIAGMEQDDDVAALFKYDNIADKLNDVTPDTTDTTMYYTWIQSSNYTSYEGSTLSGGSSEGEVWATKEAALQLDTEKFDLNFSISKEQPNLSRVIVQKEQINSAKLDIQAFDDKKISPNGRIKLGKTKNSSKEAPLSLTEGDCDYHAVMFIDEKGGGIPQDAELANRIEQKARIYDPGHPDKKAVEYVKRRSMEYRHKYNNIEIVGGNLGDNIRVDFEDDTIVGYSRHWRNIAGEETEKQKVIPAIQAVQTVINIVPQRYLLPSERKFDINEVKLFYFGMASEEQIQYLTPAWGVRIGQSRWFYVDAFTGEILN